MPTSRKLSTTLYSDSSCQFRSVGRYTTVFVWVTKYFSSSKTTEVMSKLLGLCNLKKEKKNVGKSPKKSHFKMSLLKYLVDHVRKQT